MLISKEDIKLIFDYMHSTDFKSLDDIHAKTIEALYACCVSRVLIQKTTYIIYNKLSMHYTLRPCPNNIDEAEKYFDELFEIGGSDDQKEFVRAMVASDRVGLFYYISRYAKVLTLIALDSSYPTEIASIAASIQFELLDALMYVNTTYQDYNSLEFQRMAHTAYKYRLDASLQDITDFVPREMQIAHIFTRPLKLSEDVVNSKRQFVAGFDECLSELSVMR